MQVLNFKSKKKKFKCIFEIQVRMSQNKITLYNYRDAIPRSSTMSEELGSRFEKKERKRTLNQAIGQPRERQK